MRKKFYFTAILLLLAIATGTAAYRSHEDKKPIIYSESLDEVILTVDGRPLTLKDFAFYVAYEEMSVQEQAVIYDPEQPRRYWNLYTNSTFISKAARQAILDMAVHDELFYQMAMEENLELEEEEKVYLRNEIYDFFSDLEEGQLALLGVSKEEIEASMYKIAVANKYQSILAQIEGADYEAYNYDGDAYQALLAEHTYAARETVVKRLSIGSITVNR